MSPVFRTLLLLVFTGFFYLPNANASLNGTYTIDPSQPVSKTNYKTIMAAVYDLCEGYRNDGGTSNGKGVNGAVVFNIAKGTYNEYIKITGILGAYSTNTVTFQSATGKAEDVLIQFESTDFYQVDQVLRLYGADNLIFKNLTFKHLGKTTYGCVIGLFYGADNNLFIGNNFIGRNIFSSSHPGSENAIVILANGAYNNTFTNNKFSYGTYAIYYESSIGYRINELTIKDNKFDSAYFGGLYLRNIDDLIIRNNKITNSKYDAAVDLKDCGRSLEFDGNTIYSNASTNGVLISGGKNFGLQAKIFNNFITAGRIALLVNSIKSAEIYFNNLLSLNTIDKIAALSLSLNGNAHLYNNNLIGHGTSYALQLSDTAKVISNYNNLFAQGNILVGIGTKWQTNLKSWINYSARDTHSLSTDPRFLSWTDLHIINPLLDKAGINILSVKNDIDGQVRANTKPDIGADEFTTYKDDVYLIPVDSLQPGTVCKAGLENLYVKFINLGSDTLKSLTFEWEFNSNKQNKIKWIGQLNPGDDTLIIVDTLRFTDRSNNVKIIAVLPNGQTDSNAVNNQVIYDNIYTALGGEILLGGTNPDYPTIQAAFDELHLRGVCGVTVLKLSDGEYKEQLKIKNIPGVSKTNTVTLTSESADSSKIIITYPTNKDEQNNYVLSLEGANYITLKSLTFTRTGNEVANDIISLSQGASNNNFISCQVFFCILVGCNYSWNDHFVCFI
ncbi:MAG: NosD domain-containing protein, partial [Bacteroidia bacterium]